MRFASRCFQPMLTRCVSSISASKVPTNQTLSSIAPNATRVTTLKNGLRVASEDAPGHFVGVGVYVDAGSRYEPAHLRGLSHFTDRMAFKVFPTKHPNRRSFFDVRALRTAAEKLLQPKLRNSGETSCVPAPARISCTKPMFFVIILTMY